MILGSQFKVWISEHF